MTDFSYTCFEFAGLALDGFKKDGSYYMNQTQIGSLIGKRPASLSEWMGSKGFIKEYGEVKPIKLSIPGENHWNVVSTDWVTEYLLHWVLKGNKRAGELIRILTKSSFDIMIENSLEPIEPTAVVDLIKGYNPDWKKSREYTKSIHGAFIQAYMRKGHPGAQVHNYITKLVCGQTADDARANNPQIGEDPTIGLDYQPNPEDLELIANIKLRYCGLNSGTWKEQVERSFYYVTNLR